MKLRKYIIQNEVAKWTWVDVYECFELDLARRYLVVLGNKYKDRRYRIVKEDKYV